MSAPLTPPDCDLQDFHFMPLHVARLRDSDLAAEESPEACWYAVLLWAASWHQLPAGSLPSNDAVLMRLVGLGRDHRTWKKHRDGALRGFVTCDDGRLYHPVVAEQVISAWKGKIEQRHRAECARIKKGNQRNGTDLPCPDFVAFASSNYAESVPFLSLGTAESVPRETPSKREGERKGQGQGQGQGEYKEEEPPQTPPPTDQPKCYAFEGQVIRLVETDLARWRKAYHAIPDIVAELTSLDAWMLGRSQGQQGKWFQTVAGALSRKHQEFVALAARGKDGGDLDLPIA
jgi:hypothetical protein